LVEEFIPASVVHHLVTASTITAVISTVNLAAAIITASKVLFIEIILGAVMSILVLGGGFLAA